MGCFSQRSRRNTPVDTPKLYVKRDLHKSKEMSRKRPSIDTLNGMLLAKIEEKHICVYTEERERERSREREGERGKARERGKTREKEKNKEKERERVRKTETAGERQIE